MFSLLHILPLCVCLCTLHVQVSVGLYLMVCSASSQQVCKWFETQNNDGHVDMVDHLMVFNLLCMTSCVGALLLPQTELNHDGSRVYDTKLSVNIHPTTHNSKEQVYHVNLTIFHKYTVVLNL